MNTQKVLDIYGVKLKKGEVGIEIEVEGEALPNEGVTSWLCERDGSLRGEAMEYVLRLPVARDKVGHVLSNLTHALRNSTIHDTGRAGLHVHINVQELTMTQVMNFICLYLIFEQPLVEFCGEGRPGNLFCLRTKDAGGLVRHLRRIIRNRRWRDVRTDLLRYASINVKALSTYGSLEFRAMRSTTDPVVVQDWVRILLALKDAAVAAENPQKIVEDFSLRGPEAMFYGLFGEETPVEFSYDTIMEGVRQAQHIAYCIDDWSDQTNCLEDLGKIHPAYPYSDVIRKGLRATNIGSSAWLGYYEKYAEHYTTWLAEKGNRGTINRDTINRDTPRRFRTAPNLTTLAVPEVDWNLQEDEEEDE